VLAVDRALGPAGGAARVGDAGRAIGVDVDADRPVGGGVERGGPPRRPDHPDAEVAEVAEVVVGQQHRRPRVIQQEPLLRRRQCTVHAHPHRTEPHRAVEGDDHRGVVG
jgi:hypothetical protein